MWALDYGNFKTYLKDKDDNTNNFFRFHFVFLFVDS